MLESASVSYGKVTPYFPVLDLLKRYCHIEERDDSRTIRAKVTGQVLTLDAALQDPVPAFLALLDTLLDNDLLGEIAVRHEPPESEPAAAHYRQALALAEELGMRPLQAHCHLGLGILYFMLGQQEQAYTAMSTAIDLYRAMDMTFWLPQAEATLAQVSALA